jgi:hypothetical protein
MAQITEAVSSSKTEVVHFNQSTRGEFYRNIEKIINPLHHPKIML